MDVRRIGRAFLRNRRRFAPLVLGAAVLVVGQQLHGAVPRTTSLRYVFGQDHDAITRARIAFSMHGEEVKGVDLRYPDGAPEAATHAVELVPGRYRVSAQLTGEGVSREITRALGVPAEGVVRIDLADDPRAAAPRSGL